MRTSTWLQTLLFSCLAHAQTPIRDYETNDYFALELDRGVDPHHVAIQLGVNLEGPLGEIANHFTYSCPKAVGSQVEASLQELKVRRKLRRGLESSTGLHGVRWHQKQTLRKRLVKRIPPPPADLVQRQQGPPDSTTEALDQEQQAAITKLNKIAIDLDITDPIFKEQWHLFNPIQIGHDLNVTGVWMSGITGNGTIACVIDDGLDMYSDDLKSNYFPSGSWDFNDPGPEPRPRLSDDHHGTRCAGEIAAVRNNVCGVGMAYDSQVAGVRILSKPISDEDEALAVNFKMHENHIYSCSWGPPDDGQTMEAPGVLIQKAMVTAIQQGRDGLGSVYVFAAGNGANADDNCNFDGYTNSIYSITVGGLDRAGNHPYYSEACSAQLVVTYSSGHADAIHTTDVGTNACYEGHGGTSAAGPLVVGAVALALSVRPDLSWRDLQYLVVNTAVPVHLDTEGEWQDTTIGRKFSHQFGYGKMDTWAFVEAAKNWQSVKPQAWFHSPWLNVFHEVPEGDQGLASSFDVTTEMLQAANLERLEHVTITMNVNHTRRGDLSVELRSPDGIVSHIATSRRLDDIEIGYVDWTFMSVAHWGESGIGTWTVIVKDTVVNQHRGLFIDWRLNLWGEAIDGSNQPLHPLPDEHDDDHETATAPVVVTSVDPGPTKTALPSVPTDHIERPTKPKPEDDTATPTADPAETAAPTETVSDSFLPGFFPTFGVSKRTQIWIYGSVGLIILFCVGLGAYFFVQRRKRLRNQGRDDYEFEALGDDDEGDEAKQGLTGKKGRRKRGGELYDAFAGESDEEVFSDEDEKYEDTPSATGSGSGSGHGDSDDKDRR